ncbi:MAG: hypothetical protein V4710_17425, partial [Verrucomicrobiota bacterium]
MKDLVFDPILPPGAVLALGVVLLLMRLLGGALVLILLLQPSHLERIPPPVTNRVTLIGVDSSQSMAQRDVEQGSRAEAARAILQEAEVVEADG